MQAIAKCATWIGTSCKDADYVRAIRHGVGRNGALYLTTDFPLVQAERVPQSGTRPANVAAGPTREYGDYLATTGSCKSCHLQDLSGGVPIGRNLLSANITPRGIGNWTEADFKKACIPFHRKTGEDARSIPVRTPNSCGPLTAISS